MEDTNLNFKKNSWRYSFLKIFPYQIKFRITSKYQQLSDISSLHIETMRFTHEARISKIFKGGGVVNQRIKVINIMICILYFFIVCIGFIG